MKTLNKCEMCGTCCRLFLICLDKKEYESKKYKTILEKYGFEKDFKKAKKYGLNLLAQKKDGSCIYLKNKICKIHKTRPRVCKEFFCKSKNKKNQNMQNLIETYKIRNLIH